MAVSIQADLIENAEWREQDGLVQQITRLAIVSGLVRGLPEPIHEQALTNAGMPQPGDAHPSETGLTVRERNVRVLGPTMLIVEVIYRRSSIVVPPGFVATPSGSASLKMVETEFERTTGFQLSVVHDEVTQGGSINAAVPMANLSFESRLFSSAPGALALLHVGTTNDAVWQGGVAGTWLCTNIGFVLNTDNPAANPPLWEMTYDFEFDPEGHNPAVVYIDPETGRPPPGLVDGEGVRGVLHYYQSNFDSLALDLP